MPEVSKTHVSVVDCTIEPYAGTSDDGDYVEAVQANEEYSG